MKKIIAEIKAIFIIIAIVFTFRSSFLNWYVIPTGSLQPTLKIGDHVVVNKLSYGFMLPFMEKRILSWDSPKRGDIVVFQGPEEEGSLTLIKRVVGVGGDVVTFTGGTLTVNNVLAHEELQTDRKIFENLGGEDNGEDSELFLESGFSTHPHYIMRRKYGGSTSKEDRIWKVPPGHLLLVGDNRDNSKDGRMWGFIDQNRIYGRAVLISYSTQEVSEQWLPKLRPERWFQKILN